MRWGGLPDGSLALVGRGVAPEAGAQMAPDL